MNITEVGIYLGVFVLRTYALWNCDRRVRIALLVLYLVSILPQRKWLFELSYFQLRVGIFLWDDNTSTGMRATIEDS